MRKLRRSLGVALVLVGLSLTGQLSVALLPMHHPVRIAVQLVATVMMMAAALAIYAAWRSNK
ncbi:MAG: hypothetical protein AA908_01410 [Chlorobi bacterium NICIL-2]|jgi:protein-S-isoprenylcysteine O-methyltransferase Ste14|nr:MAG: hypothetical protein AA908_01410 [Chlorobi bacterium NICIL-2]GBD05327.1 hypothetical protein HRbin20_00908 [bacterium HR20]